MRVAFTGIAGAGKTTAALALQREYGGEIRSFASPLKIAARMIGWDGKKDPKGRWLLQRLGDEGRAVDPLLFVNIAFRDLSDSVYIDDLRFPNEAEAARAHGFVIVRVERVVPTPSPDGTGANFGPQGDPVDGPHRAAKYLSPVHSRTLEAALRRLANQYFDPSFTPPDYRGHKSETAVNLVEPDFVIPNDGSLAAFEARVRELVPCLTP
ncbi:MAG: hypothetical protein KatS3mg082_1386 [Nitrospiraceae bacterium]|nr:MAG: hypothetical protein KatS3mg082_1386 [Nitrospiraceae bacterium]